MAAPTVQPEEDRTMTGTGSALVAVALLALGGAALAEDPAKEPAKDPAKDVVKTSAGDLEITFVGHGSLVFAFGGKVLHVDPYSKLTDYAKLPKADAILITHGHGDHLDAAALAAIRTPKTVVVVAPGCEGKVEGAVVMKNGDERAVAGVPVTAVPAYNIVGMRSEGVPYHPKGEGNGYVLSFGDTRVYVAGDTENVPEMKALKGIAVAFLPMNLPYTMTPEMVADAAKAFRPRVLYPYHFGATDPARVVDLLKDVKEIEVRVRSMK
jgi:L-ascorbate metabolism protein UlaG (beta-lactamase superfamily)